MFVMLNIPNLHPLSVLGAVVSPSPALPGTVAPLEGSFVRNFVQIEQGPHPTPPSGSEGILQDPKVTPICLVQRAPKSSHPSRSGAAAPGGRTLSRDSGARSVLVGSPGRGGDAQDVDRVEILRVLGVVVVLTLAVTERIPSNFVVGSVLGILRPVARCSRQTTGRVIRTVSPLRLLPHPGQNEYFIICPQSGYRYFSVKVSPKLEKCGCQSPVICS